MPLCDANNVASTKSGLVGPDRIGLFISVCGFNFTWFSIWFSVTSKFKRVFYFFFRFVFDLSGNLATPLISNSRKTQMVLRGMRDKANVAKITSRWLNIVGIRRKSRVSNNTRDFDLAMWST